MTVYWCDPYIDAVVDGIHGTTETTTRTGTYAAPFSFSDVNNAQANNNFPGATLVNGDEIRIKGLANVSAYQIDIGNDWYCSSYYHLYNYNAQTAFTAARTAKGDQNGFAFMLDPDLTEKYMVANSDGVIPPYIFTGGYNQSGANVQAYSSGPQAGFWRSVLQHVKGSSNRTLQVYLIDPDYYVNVQNSTGSTYPFAKTDIDLKVTDGWTSETVRNGVSILVLEAANMGNTGRYFYFNSSNSSRQYGTNFDCLNTYFVAIDTDDTSAYARPYFYTNSAGGTYAGNKFTQKYGSFIKSDGGYPNYFYEAYYYQYNDSDASSSSNTPGACNNLEVGMTGCYYGGYFYARYGDQVEYRLNNIFARASGMGYFNMYNYSGSRHMDLKIGSSFTYQGQSGNFFYNTSNMTGGDHPDITFLDSAHLVGYTSAESLFNYSDSDLLQDVTFGPTKPVITVNDYPERFHSSTTGPALVSIVGRQPSYVKNIPMDPTSWTSAAGVFYDGRTSTPHDLAEANIPLGVMETDDSDYRNTNVNIKAKTDMYLYESQSHTSGHNGDVNMHFSSNTFDGKPIGLMLSSSLNNYFHAPMIYYNDSAEDNALVIQGNSRAQDNYRFVKKVEIPIPKHTTEDIRISINWKVSANWPSGRAIYFNVGHASTTGNLGFKWTNLYNNSNPVSTNSSYTTTTVDIPNSELPALKLNHMKIGIDVYNPNSHEHKLYIKTIEASVV